MSWPHHCRLCQTDNDSSCITAGLWHKPAVIWGLHCRYIKPTGSDISYITACFIWTGSDIHFIIYILIIILFWFWGEVVGWEVGEVDVVMLSNNTMWSLPYRAYRCGFYHAATIQTHQHLYYKVFKKNFKYQIKSHIIIAYRCGLYRTAPCTSSSSQWRMILS